MYKSGNINSSQNFNTDNSYSPLIPDANKKFTASTPDIRVTPSIGPLNSQANKFGHNSVDVISLKPTTKPRSRSVQHRVQISERIGGEADTAFKNLVTKSDPEKIELKVADVNNNNVSSNAPRSNKGTISVKKQKLPRLDLLSIHESHEIGNSPRLSSRHEDKRQSDLDKIFIETYKLNGIGNLKPIVEKVSEFDKNLNEHLQKTWPGALEKLLNWKNLSPLSKSVDKSYRMFLANEIDALCKYESLEPQDLDESPRVIQLYNYIQRGGVLLKDIFPRFRLLRSILDSYLTDVCKRNVSPYAERLYTFLDRFLEIQEFPETMNIVIEENDFFGFRDDSNISLQPNPIKNGKEIEHFLKVYEEVVNLLVEKKDSKLNGELKRWALAPLGETAEERNDVIEELRKWVALTSARQKQLFLQLKADSWSTSRTSYYLSQISKIYHRWYQNKSLCENSLDTISYLEIYEKWRGMVKAFNRVTVNGKTFWDSNTKHLGVTHRHIESHARKSPRHSPKNNTNSGITEIKRPESPKIDYTVKEILEGLFTAMSGKEKSNEEIVCDVAEFVAASKDTSFKTPDIELRIPCIPLMRLSTDTAWKEAEFYMSKLFPDLFLPPYSVKYEGQTECVIDVKENVVTQKKVASVYLTSNKLGAEPRKQVNLMMAWSLNPIDVRWAGALSIEHYEVIDEDNWVDLRQKLVETVDFFGYNNNGITYSSGQSTSLYTRKTVSNKGRSSSLNPTATKDGFK